MIEYRVQATAEEIGEALDKIKSLFKPGSKVAIAVWHPEGGPDADFIMLSPDVTLDEAASIFLRRRDDPHNIFGKIGDAA